VVDAPTPAAAPPPDPAAILRSKSFVALIVFAAAIGVVVSLIGWGFLELVHQIQVWVFTNLPKDLGLDPVPRWWSLPVCGLAGLPVAFAIVRLPGKGGHVPANGLQMGGIEPNMVPGIALAALATLGLGIVLGPEAPLIAIGTGVAIFTVNLAKRDAAPQMVLVLGAAGSFAAISVIFGSPLVAAILVIEASGLGGATLSLIMIPGLVAAGVGSLIFIGMADWTGLSTSAYSLTPLHLASFGHPTLADIGWAILLGIGAALVTYPVRQIGLRVARLVPTNPYVLIPIAGLAVAGLAIAYSYATGNSVSQVLFSGQDALGGLVSNAGTYSVGTLLMLMLCKGVAWAVSLGSFRGGPTFPAMFLGAAGGIAASHLPGLPASPAVAVGIGAMTVAFLKLPLSAIVIATALTFSGGPGLVPLIIVGVVVAYIAILTIDGKVAAPAAPSPPAPT
jgi:H+/Cl- antiporter ClcA